MLEDYYKYKKVFVKRRNINFVKKDKESLLVKTTQNLVSNFATVNKLLGDAMFMCELIKLNRKQSAEASSTRIRKMQKRAKLAKIII